MAKGAGSERPGKGGYRSGGPEQSRSLRVDKIVLSKREREIVFLLSEGYLNKQIAGVLNISTRTVELHRANIMRKLGLDSFPQLVRFAVRNGIVKP